MNETRYRRAEAALFEAAGINPREHWIDLRTIGSTARVLDVGDGAPVLFLTGGPAAAATWSYVAAAAKGLRCLLLDRPGTGLSSPAPKVPDVHTMPRYVVDLTSDALDALGIDTATIVGSSFGGNSALRSAASLPDRVSRVVLAGCPPFVPGWRPPGFFTILRTPLFGRLFLALPVTRASVRMALRQFGHTASLQADRIPLPMIDWERSWQRDTDTMRNDAAMIKACGTLRGGFDDSLELSTDDLARVAAPCHIVVGTMDSVGGETVARNLAGALPNASVEIWDRAGHLPWLDDPGRLAAAIERFLTASPSTREDSGPVTTRRR